MLLLFHYPNCVFSSSHKSLYVLLLVHTVSLTTDGSTLYSGGAEGVLVVWHNINTTSSTGATKSFFPRLGCPISFLTNNSRYYCTLEFVLFLFYRIE